MMGFARRLSDGLEDWWADYARSLRRRGRSDTTTSVYRRSFERFWIWALDHQLEADPAAITMANVNEWVDHLQGEVGPSTVTIQYRNLRPFFTWWARETDAVNPFERADVPTAPTALVPVVAIDDIRALLDACKGRTFDDRRDTAIVLVLVDCGLRLGELVGLAVDDWDRRADLLAVNGKTGPRIISHSAATGEALARYLRERGSHPAAGSDALWLGRKGPLRDSAVGQMLKRRCDQAGIDGIHPHQLRHTWAHQAKTAGIDTGDLQVLAGWKTPAMAHRYGASAASERARDHYRRHALGDRL